VKKRVWIVLLLGLFLLGGCARASSTAKPIYARLTVPVFFESEIPKDIDKISEAVSRLTEEKIGASITLMPLLYVFGISDTSDVADPVKMSELELLEKQGVTFDVLPDDMPGARFLELDNLLDQYGREAKAVIGDELLNFTRADGKLYVLPSVSDYVASSGVAMRKDIVEKYDIDLSSIHSLKDLDPVLERVHALEPDLRLISPNQTRRGFLGRLRFDDAFLRCVCDLDPENPSRVVNYYATDEYRDAVNRFRRWYLSSYLPDQMMLQNTRAEQLMQAGELFAYNCAYKPGVDYEESMSSGRDVVVAPLMEPVITRRSLDSSRWGISQSCLNPGKAMQFLNLLYTDSDLVNLLIYGIEGEHYVRLPDGTIGYPDGMDAETAGYRNTVPWVLPNQLLSYVWHGNDPDVWKKTEVFNKTARVSKVIGFTFDPGPVQQENDALNGIVSNYSYGLETGQLDPDVYLTKMLKEMEEAGVERVIAEAQRQYDLFLKGENEQS
jgi:putative aldouronate transport system substrate-binding protein